MVFFHKHTLIERSPILNFNYCARDKRKKETTRASIHVTNEQQSEIDYLCRSKELIASHVYSMYLKRLSQTQTLIIQPSRILLYAAERLLNRY